MQNPFINYNLPHLNDIIDGSQGGYLRTDLILKPIVITIQNNRVNWWQVGIALRMKLI
jgi:hypothetical protein